jgi:small-conductance mechanosensitive channel
MTSIQEFFGGEMWGADTLPGAILYAVLFFVLATVLLRVLRIAVDQLLKRDRKKLIDRTMVVFLSQLAHIGVYLLAFILYAQMIPGLRSLGVALLTGFSVASVIVGLAASDTLGNLIAGVSLLLYRPFEVGDWVQINSPTDVETGIIETLTLGYTVLRTFDNRRVMVPNSVMTSEVMVNLSANDPRTMALIPIGIAYGADIDLARRILVELAENHPLVDEVIDCPVTELGDFSINLLVRAWCKDPFDARQVRWDINEQAKKRFDREEVEIPFPYTNVLLQNVGR